MKLVKKYSFYSVPFYTDYGKVLVSPRFVYVYNYGVGNFFRYTHTEFFERCFFARADFLRFVHEVFHKKIKSCKL